MITIGMIEEGLRKGIARPEPSPADGDPACRIGDYWFYIGEPDGRSEAERILSALEGIRDDLDGDAEYGYYEAILNEAGIFPEEAP